MITTSFNQILAVAALGALSSLSGIAEAQIRFGQNDVIQALAQRGYGPTGEAILEQEQGIPRYSFYKDAPILGFTITENSPYDLPIVIKELLGEVDYTGRFYDRAYFQANVGSIIALQTTTKKRPDGASIVVPDFYIVGKGIFDLKYVSKPGQTDFKKKNPKGLKSLKSIAEWPKLERALERHESRLVSATRTAPQPLFPLSDLGVDPSSEVVFEGPWGEQTKSAGADAFIAYDPTPNIQQFYLINSDASGLPSGYVPLDELTKLAFETGLPSGYVPLDELTKRAFKTKCTGLLK